MSKILSVPNIDASCDHEILQPQASDPPPLFVAKYDYVARENGDLTIKKGDLVYIVDDKEEGWWLVKSKLSGQVGYIPSNYIVKFKSFDAEE